MSAPLPADDAAAQPQPARTDVGNWATAGFPIARDPAADRHTQGISGRRVTGPMQGFGRLYQRTYVCALGTAVTPQHAIAVWRAHFGEFWPKGNRFHGAIGGIRPGDIAPISVRAGGGLRLETGVLVLYADDESFAFMTPEGHMFAGMITFSAAVDDQGVTQLQVQVLVRPNDPLYDLGILIMRAMEDRFWATTMRNVAARLGAGQPPVDVTGVIVDRKRLWHNVGNIRYNAGIRSALHLIAAPFALLARRIRHR